MADREDVASTEPPPPNERPGPRTEFLTGCIVLGVVALLPLLYVGSFGFLVADEWYGWGFMESLDDRTIEILVAVYWPLIWLYRAILGV